MNATQWPETNLMTDSAPYAISTLERLLEQRFSCRGYLPKPVDEQTIAQILKVAQRTASWCNAQPWKLIITSGEALGVYGAVDCGAYVANFMLAARALGVASIAQAAIASRSRFVRQYFGLPDDRKVVCGISFGYEDPAHPANSFRTSRADWQSEVRFLS